MSQPVVRFVPRHSATPDHPGFGHPTLMKLALFVQTSGVRDIVETAPVISGGVHHAPIDPDHLTGAGLAGDG
jgi:hypothetical protein